MGNYHPLFSGDGGPAIEQIPALPPFVWAGMTLAIGAADALRIQTGWANPYDSMDNIQTLKPGYYPGDLDFDPLNLRNPRSFASCRRRSSRTAALRRLLLRASSLRRLP